MSDSTRRRSAAKLPDGFPLWRHPSGRWCKKVRGKAHYFGSVANDPDGKAALLKWLSEKDDLLAGRKPRPKTAGLTVVDLANHYLTHKERQRDAGEITPGTFGKCRRACKRFVRVLTPGRVVADLRPDDFARLADDIAPLAPASRRLEIIATRGAFKFAYDSELLDRPIRFGPSFAPPSRRIIQRSQRERGPKMFQRDEVLALLGAANRNTRAMILLGVNCGFGQFDCATLTHDSLDLEAGWVFHPRPKTGAERRAKLWPETIAALRAVQAKGKAPVNPADARLVFITCQGRPFVRQGGRGWNDTVRPAFNRLLDKLNLQRPGRGFYGLRHTFETIAGGSKDQVAVNLVMGHTDPSMAANYRHGVDDARLVAVAEHVHVWLFGEKGGSHE